MMIRQSLQNIWAAFTASLLRLKALSKRSSSRSFSIRVSAEFSSCRSSLSPFCLATALPLIWRKRLYCSMMLLRRRILEHCRQGLKPTASLSAQRKCPSAQAFTAAVADGRALVGFGSPEDFAQKLARGETAPVYVAADARNTTTANVAVGYAAAIIEEFNASRQVRSVLELKDRYRYNENGITRWNIMTGLILGLAMIQVMLLAGLAVSRERERGSFDMMLMTPLTPSEILIGKAVPPIVIGVLQSAMIFAVCRWWFDDSFLRGRLLCSLASCSSLRPASWGWRS